MYRRENDGESKITFMECENCLESWHELCPLTQMLLSYCWFCHFSDFEERKVHDFKLTS